MIRDISCVWHNKAVHCGGVLWTFVLADRREEARLGNVSSQIREYFWIFGDLHVLKC